MTEREEPRAIAIAKSRKRDRQPGSRRRQRTGVELEAVSRDHLGAVGAVALLIGLWGLAALIAAVVSSGGPLALLDNWFKAVTGLW